MADSDGGHIWPPRSSDLRIQELTGLGPEESTPDHVYQFLRGLGYTGSMDDMWHQHLAALGITDTSEPFTTPLGAGDPFLSNVKVLYNYDDASGHGAKDWSELSSDRTVTFDTVAAVSDGTIGPAPHTGSTYYQYLDGNFNRWCSVPDSGTDLDPGTGDYTVEWYSYKSGWNVIDYQFGMAGLYCMMRRSTENYEFKVMHLGLEVYGVNAQAANPLNQWVHVAACRHGTDLRVFFDGTQLGATVTNSDDLVLGPTAFYVGSANDISAAASAHMDGFRYTVGAARYTTNFTPPELPLPAPS